MSSKELLKQVRDAQKNDGDLSFSLLSKYLKSNSGDVDGWILMAELVHDPAMVIDCLKRVVVLRPEIHLLRKRIDGFMGNLKYYEQIIEVIEGYGQWKIEKKPNGMWRYYNIEDEDRKLSIPPEIDLNAEYSELKILRDTRKKQKRHLKDLLKIISEAKGLYYYRLDEIYRMGLMELISLGDDSPSEQPSTPAAIYELGYRKFDEFSHYHDDLPPEGPLTLIAENNLNNKLSGEGLEDMVSKAINQVNESIFRLDTLMEKKRAVEEKPASSKSRAPIPDDVKMFVWNRDEGKCAKCGSQFNLEYDHIIPVSKGGSNTARNIQLLCEPCNRKKSNNPV